LGFKPCQKSLAMVSKTKTIKLLVILSACARAHLSPGTSRCLSQTRFELLDTMRLSLPPFIRGHTPARAQHRALSILASTDAAIPCFNRTNAAFQISVGARNVFPIVTAHQMGPQMDERQSQWFEPLGKWL
jgi:hypothetical protein